MFFWDFVVLLITSDGRIWQVPDITAIPDSYELIIKLSYVSGCFLPYIVLLMLIKICYFIHEEITQQMPVSCFTELNEYIFKIKLSTLNLSIPKAIL